MPVKSYSYNDKTQLSKNFNISEFKCKCGRNHNILNSTELVNMLQKITDLVGADYVTISSGYRCAYHDRNVGGSGNGPHTGGFAADCCFVKNGEAISTKLLSCVAQDMGFMGIANITSDYHWIHLDMKGRVYKGNEIVSNNTVTTDFYAYYGITKDKVLELTGGKDPGNQNTSSTIYDNKINTKDKQRGTIVWSNKYDAKIKEVQRIFNQKGYRLVEDGYAGRNTYAVAKKFTINKGDNGPLVRCVQERLNSMGYNCGIADGRCGVNTMAGIAAFQKAYKLGVGYLGGTDWVYLFGGTIL